MVPVDAILGRSLGRENEILIRPKSSQTSLYIRRT